MVGCAQGNPWALSQIMGDEDPEPSREEVVAELILFMRETVRELGEQRATGIPEEVLRLVPAAGGSRLFKQELVQLATLDEVEQRLLPPHLARASSWSVSKTSCRKATKSLDLLISIYGGG